MVYQGKSCAIFALRSRPGRPERLQVFWEAGLQASGLGESWRAYWSLWSWLRAPRRSGLRRGGSRASVHSVTAARDAYVAGRDISHNEITNVTQARQSNPFGLLAGVCLVALLACVTGTALLAQAPGGVFQQSPQTRRQSTDSGNGPGSAASPASGHSSAANAQPVVHYTLAATYDETNSNGDSITQAISFSSPVSLDQVSVLRQLSKAGGPCGSPPKLPVTRDLRSPSASHPPITPAYRSRLPFYWKWVTSLIRRVQTSEV